MKSSRPLPAAALLFVLLTSVSSFAQTDATLLTKPWNGDQVFEFTGSAVVPNQSHIKGSSVFGDAVDIQVRQYQATARGRLDPDDPMKISFGFDMTVLNFDENSDAIDEKDFRQLADQSVAGGMGIGEIDGWQVGVVAGFGFGYIGDQDEIARAEGYYGKGDVIASRSIDEKSTLILMLDYNGNRTLFPDVPLPYVSYIHEESPEFGYILGVPANGVWWEPIEHLKFNLEYLVPFTVNAEVSYQVVKELKLFGQFENGYQGFLDDNETQSHRLFFQQRRLEVGLDWNVIGKIDLILAGGYLFGQEFDEGWDSRDTDTIFKITDAPYLRFGITANF